MAKGGTQGTQRTADDQNTPRAIIHKQILEQADSDPDASMEAIADAISGATTATVERVLEEYGDPAAKGSSEEITGKESDIDLPSTAKTVSTEKGTATTDGGVESESTQSTMGDDTAAKSPITVVQEPDDQDSDLALDQSALTEKQHETLQAIYEHPDATQADLADRLGVSSPTISQRVNSIEGFDWSNRHALVTPLFSSDDDNNGEGEEETMTSTDDTENTNDSDEVNRDEERKNTGRQRTENTDQSGIDEQRLTRLATQVERLTEQVAAVERELATREKRTTAPGGKSSVLSDPELAHKIVHACIHSDRITEEEELRLLRDVTAVDAVDSSAENSA